MVALTVFKLQSAGRKCYIGNSGSGMRMVSECQVQGWRWCSVALLTPHAPGA
jgi:hypothetical protein